MKRILSYLNKTGHFDILYNKKKSCLIVFTDNDYRRDTDSERNISGYIFFLGSEVI